MEIELKFIVPDEETLRHLTELTRLGEYELVPTSRKVIRDEYLDTPDLRVLQGGYALRARHSTQGIEITVKGLGKAEAALHQRAEYNFELARLLPPAEWPQTPARELVLKLLGDAELQTLVTLKQERIIRVVKEVQRVLAELSLDCVTYAGNAEVGREYELELELKQGTEAELGHLGGLLTQMYALKPQTESKFARALARSGVGDKLRVAKG